MTRPEDVAALLWDSELQHPWRVPEPAARSVRAVMAGLPPATPAAHRIPLAVAAARVADPLAGDRHP